MGKNKVAKIDYSTFSLEDVINKVVGGRETSFCALDKSKKNMVLEFVFGHDIPVKVFDQRGYDVLSDEYFVEEYVKTDEGFFGYKKEDKRFSSFGELFEYTNGDPFTNSCYFGCRFSGDEVHRYDIRIGLLNSRSFVN